MNYVATTVAIFAGIAAVAFNGWQLFNQLKTTKFERLVELRGVSITWKALDVPIEPSRDGWSVAEHLFTLHNTSKLPISDIRVIVTAPCGIKRVHYDGSNDGETRTIELSTPVLEGAGKREWRRKLSVRWPDRAGMRDLRAEVHFYSLYSEKREKTEWGPSDA